VPNQPRTPGRMFRINPDLYAAAKAVAAARGETLTAVVTLALTRYVRRNSDLGPAPWKPEYNPELPDPSAKEHPVRRNPCSSLCEGCYKCLSPAELRAKLSDPTAKEHP